MNAIVSQRSALYQADPAKQARLQSFQKLIFQYGRFQDVVNAMTDCMVLSKCRREPFCMMLTGAPGVGKTSAIEIFEAMYPRRVVGKVSSVPVFTTLIPKPARVNNIVSSMLKSLGAPFHERGTVASRMTRLYKLLETCQVQLVILDEFQHLIEKGTEHQINEVSDWIKTMINQTKIPVVLAGMPTALDVLDYNPQLARRFRRRISMAPFSWSTDQDEFKSMLQSMEAKLPLPLPSGLDCDDMAKRLWLASKGNMSNLMHMVNEVLIDAVLLDAPRLEKRMFDHFLKDEGLDRNPFSMKAEQVDRELAVLV